MRSQLELFAAIKTNNLILVVDNIKKYGFKNDYFNGTITFLALAVLQGKFD